MFSYKKKQIPRMDPDDAVRTLGWYIAPNRSSKMQVEILLQKALHFKKVLSSPTVSKVDGYILYRVFFFPDTSYPLGVFQISDKDLKKIESKYLTPTKQQMGLRRTTSRRVWTSLIILLLGKTASKNAMWSPYSSRQSGLCNYQHNVSTSTQIRSSRPNSTLPL